jgi:hypothetical protein
MRRFSERTQIAGSWTSTGNEPLLNAIVPLLLLHGRFGGKMFNVKVGVEIKF